MDCGVYFLNMITAFRNAGAALLLCFCVLFCALLVILSLLLVIMGGQHDGLFLSGSPPILYIYKSLFHHTMVDIYIHMYIFLMANKLCCCCCSKHACHHHQAAWDIVTSSNGDWHCLVCPRKKERKTMRECDTCGTPLCNEHVHLCSDSVSDVRRARQRTLILSATAGGVTGLTNCRAAAWTACSDCLAWK